MKPLFTHLSVLRAGVTTLLRKSADQTSVFPIQTRQRLNKKEAVPSVKEEVVTQRLARPEPVDATIQAQAEIQAAPASTTEQAKPITIDLSVFDGSQDPTVEPRPIGPEPELMFDRFGEPDLKSLLARVHSTVRYMSSQSVWKWLCALGVVGGANLRPQDPDLAVSYSSRNVRGVGAFLKKYKIKPLGGGAQSRVTFKTLKDFIWRQISACFVRYLPGRSERDYHVAELRSQPVEYEEEDSIFHKTLVERFNQELAFPARTLYALLKITRLSDTEWKVELQGVRAYIDTVKPSTKERTKKRRQRHRHNGYRRPSPGTRFT